MKQIFQTLSKNQIRELAKLRQRKFRRLSSQYIISGLRAVRGSLQAVDFLPLAVLLQKGQEGLLQNLSLAEAIPRYLLEEQDFLRISAENTPQGIALLAKQPYHSWRDEPPGASILIYLQEINDPGNLGSIIRSALWFGYNEILLSPNSVDPFGPKAVRSSAGYVTHCRIYEEIDIAALQAIQKNQKYKVIGTALQEAQEVTSFLPKEDERFILLFGSEAHGLSADLVKLCNQKLTIPKIGYGESLNLATSVALFLYQAGICSR